jgi:hypothetical protein
MTAGAVAAVVVAIWAAVDAGTPPVPSPLDCLARHYRVTPVFDGGAWFARLPDGTRLPFDDGKDKTFDERLVAPDVEDVFLIPYRPGPIRAVTDENDDPGRIRLEAVFTATYGPRPAAEQVRTTFLGMPVRMHRLVVPALGRVATRLEQARRADSSLAPFLRKLAGGFAARKIAGTDRTSAHAFGIAIDLDKAHSDYWRWEKSPPLRWRNRIPQAIVDAFEAEGFIWGGRWYHYDTMHFEYRPELLESACRPAATSGSRPR